MTPLSKTVLSVAAITTLALSTQDATATDQAFAASEVCQNMNQNSAIGWNFGSAKNHGPGPQGVTCGVGQDNALDTNDDVLIYFVDGNTESSDSADVFCSGTEMLDDGTVFAFIPQKRGCGTTGGCDSWTPGWSGSGEIRLENARHGGSYFTVVTCNLPRPQGSSLSEIYALTIDEQ